MTKQPTSLGGGRFELRRKLGVGGMGAVYEAFDRRKNELVAAKNLGQIDAVAVHAFKAEFRDFRHLHHDNLIVLDELFSEGDDWYFTMELLADGRDFLSYVRPPGGAGVAVDSVSEPDVLTQAESSAVVTERPISPRTRQRPYPGTLDLQALHSALRQLAAGLGHLHAAGKIHRDVKSSNLIVSREGRVVLLDFGIAIDAKSKSVHLAGTPMYMAPELFWQSATPAADWYSVGVVLYQALTGTEPWPDNLSSIVTPKRAPPVHPNDIAPAVPEELAELCMALLETNPKKRANRQDVLEWLESSSLGASDRQSIPPEVGSNDLFVGREAELLWLTAAYDELSRQTGPILLYVQGESGIGKSALVNEFLEVLNRREKTTVLRGHVLEEEVVPYKSLDGIVDSLCERLLLTNTELIDGLLPEGFGIVAEVFPTLRRVVNVAKLPRVAIAEPAERRALMFSALKECLRRLAELRPLILTVEDLQWSDADSLQLWNELLRGADAPRMLVIATLRTERTGSIRPSKRPPSVLPALIGNGMPALPVPTRSIWLPRLSESEAQAYVEARMAQSVRRSKAPEAIVQEANGHPLFIDELLRYRGADLGKGQLTLDLVLTQRIEQLQPAQQLYLKLVCVSAKPLNRSLFTKAAGLPHGNGLRAYKALREGRLVRTGRDAGADGDDWVDAFHYRVRNACLAACDASELSELHGKLAATMEAEGRIDSEHLAIEWAEAGNEEKAAHYSERAGDAAFKVLAFQKAAEFYGAAIRNLPAASAVKISQLRERLGRSLRNSGQARAAAGVFVELADETRDTDRAFHLRCEAAELLMQSGFIDEGVIQLDLVLRESGVERPRTQRRAMLSLVWWTMRLKVRGLKWVTAKSLDPTSQRSLDALWSATSGLGPVDQFPAYACGAEFTYRALESGVEVQVAKAFALEAMSAAAQGKAQESVERIRSAERLLARLPAAEGQLAVIPAAKALSTMMSGSWRTSLESATAAQSWIRQHCVGAFGQVALAEVAELWSLASMGEFCGLVRRQQELLLRASERNDLYTAVGLSSGLPNVAYLAQDDGEKALEQTTTALNKWSKHGFYMQHAFDAFARAQALLYLKRYDAAALVVSTFKADRKKHGIVVPQPLAPYFVELEGRIALAKAFETNAPRPTAAAVHLGRLRKESVPWAQALAALLSAGVDHASGNKRAAATSATEAARLLRAVDMKYHATVADVYAAQLRSVGGLDFTAALATPGVSSPMKFARFTVPGLQ